MRIGLVGKPNVGKSTAFAALTESAVEIANYPFTTIDPNVGVTFLPADANCPCESLRQNAKQMGVSLQVPKRILVQEACVNPVPVPASAFAEPSL